LYAQLLVGKNFFRDFIRHSLHIWMAPVGCEYDLCYENLEVYNKADSGLEFDTSLSTLPTPLPKRLLLAHLSFP